MSEQDLSQPDHRENPPTIASDSSLPKWKPTNPFYDPYEDCNKEISELQSEIKSLKSSLIKAEAEAVEMRKAFERILVFEISPQEYDIIEVWKIARDTLSLDVGKDFLKRYEAMSKVCEAARLLSPHTLFHNPEIRDALSALDAIRAEEKA